MGSNNPQNAGFTGVGTQSFDTASMESMFSSLQSEYGSTAGGFSGFGGPATTTSSGSGTSSTGTSSSGASETKTSTTLATSVSPTAGAADSATQSLSSSVTETASNAAASTTDGPVTVSEKSSCNSISCSSGLQAAVAVPIVIAAIAAILLFFCCARRRRKRAGAVVSEKRPPQSGKKLKWTRHLRAFSFDAELLLGGRFSGSNSLRSRGAEESIRSDPAPSSRDGASSVEPSLHSSVEEVAPPYRDYRDMISHATPPSPLRSIPAITTTAPDPIPRPSSTATAPPPYRSIVPGTSPEPTSPSTVRNPFSDSPGVSPIDESPFNDPPGTALAPALSRGSSMYRSVNSDDTGSPAASDAGSIMEAVVGRRVSVRNAGATTGGSS
ncbi:hypothetical protein H2200_009806 [Cladophialophora chaetospira]|uniref:Uncharacterized protein n=1 Tax=Cladophialophora chaetospira TaxID=386627 RepID=A0AA38X3G0_9EURO|nr:hypothetical protein H2200_009806 [Cladophialophora chaetospira]